MADEPYQVQWKTRRHWKVGPAFRTRKEANEYVEMRRQADWQEARIYNLKSGRELTDEEIRLLLNIAHTERRRWQRRVVAYFRSGNQQLMDRTGPEYLALDKIAHEYPIQAFDMLTIASLRAMVEERRYREEARKIYGSDEVEVDDDAKVAKGEGGSFVQAWVWVPERQGAGVDDGCE